MINFDKECFYFISGYRSIHTGHEVYNMIRDGCMLPDSICKITGALDLLLWFKEPSFYKSRISSLLTKNIVEQVPLTCVDLVSTIISENLKVNLIMNGRTVKSI